MSKENNFRSAAGTKASKRSAPVAIWVRASSVKSAATATNGIEMRVPFADLGLAADFKGAISVAACIQRTTGAVSNQWLPGLAAGSAALGLAPNLVSVPGVQHKTVFVGLLGDVDGDGAVGGTDLAAVLGAWGQTSSTAGYLAADLNGDSTVDASDLSIVLAQWGL